ncbi:MAG TPA: site-specific integrase, partial [Candidatus Nitrosotenuis sp.]
MSYLQNTLSRQEWLDRTYRKSKSQRALELAQAALKSFDAFCSEKYGKDPDTIISELRGNPGDRTYIFLNNFVAFMDNKSPKTVQTYFGLVKSFLRTQGVKTDRDDVREFVKLPTLLKIRRKPLTKEIIRKLLDNSKERRKALYLTLLSSGMRLGEALSLKKENFDFTKDPVMVFVPAACTKTRESRETFI